MSKSNKAIVNEVNEAFSNNRVEDFLKHCSDAIVWRMVGEKTTTGIDEIRAWMSQVEGTEPPVFTVDEMIAEGDSVICRGDMTMKGESGNLDRYAYCDSYRFSEGKITELDSYVIKIKDRSEDQKSASA